jgi:hypothetical protein
VAVGRHARHGKLAVLLVIAVIASSLPAHGGVSWEPLASDQGALRSIATQGSTGLAVGDSGLVLRTADGAWEKQVVPTTKDLNAVAYRHAGHAAVVGEDGVVLELKHRYAAADPAPPGIVSAVGTTGGSRAQWQIPLAPLALEAGAPLGIRASAFRGGGASHHPAASIDDSPETAAAILLADIPRGTPPIDGEAHPTWTTALTITQGAGGAPFTLHLLRDSTHLYAMMSATGIVPPDRFTFQLAARHGLDLTSGDVRVTREGAGLAASLIELVPPQPTWGSLVVAGAEGKVAVRTNGAWTTLTATGAPTLRAAALHQTHVYLAGGNAQGTSGATIHRLTGTTLSIVPVPPGNYGLHDIDMAACRAVGSGGTVLRCLDGDPTQWLATTLDGAPALRGVAHDTTSGRTWAAGASGGTGALYFLNSGGHWIPHALPAGTTAITSLEIGLGGPLVTTLTGDILVLRAHAPRFVEYPLVIPTSSGGLYEYHIFVEDPDNDILDLDVRVPDILDPPDVTQPVKDLFRVILKIPHGVHGTHVIEYILSDGDETVSGNSTIIIGPVNGPPVWNPHPNVVIPRSAPWTTAVHASDPDGDPLTLAALSLPVGMGFIDLGSGDGSLDWTPGLFDVGTHTVALEADDGALTATLVFTVTVLDRQPPVIDFVTPTNPRICVKGPWWPGTLTFTAGAHDPDGGPVTYTWTFGDDGSVATGQQVSHTFVSAGAYTVTLVVTNNVGLTATRTIPVRVIECVRAEVEMDEKCFRIIDGASGRVRLYDHQGLAANGTFEVTVWWKPLHGPERVSRLTGLVINGVGTFVVPYDHSPYPLNDPVRHDVTARATKTDSPVNPPAAAATTHYRVEPDCKHVPWPF